MAKSLLDQFVDAHIMWAKEHTDIGDWHDNVIEEVKANLKELFHEYFDFDNEFTKETEDNEDR